MNKIAVKHIAFLLFFLSITNLFAQHEKFSLSVSYPVLLGGKTPQNTIGIVDVGVDYRLLNRSKIRLGTSFNVSFLRNNTVSEREYFKRITILEPKVFIALNLNAIEPYLGMGYTYFRTYEEFDFGETELIVAGGGFGFNIGSSIRLLKKLFGHIEYAYGGPKTIPIKQPDFIENTKMLRKINILKIGVDFRF